MKTIKDKRILVGVDFPLKEATVEYLEKKGWAVNDMGARKDSDI